MRPLVLITLAALALPLSLAPRAQADPIEFLHALDNSPLEFKYRTDQTLSEAVEGFYQSGENPYVGDEEALKAGKKVYKKLCQACHLPDGSGRIGPSLDDDKWKYERTDTDIGRFEIIYGGGAGSMQAFGRRIDQDELLKVMAYIDTFRE
ncbi:MAG: cytochrome c [Rhodobacteraceae bacterium]|nr:cytochrome c [Paracoccaceae bacterium]